MMQEESEGLNGVHSADLESSSAINSTELNCSDENIPDVEDSTVPNGITAEKLQQLMTEVEHLKKEQLTFRNEQDQ